LAAQLTREYRKARIAPATEPLHPDFERWMHALQRHLEGSEPSLQLPLDIRATAFQMKVWNYLRQIPYGSECAVVLGGGGSGRAASSGSGSGAGLRVQHGGAHHSLPSR